MMTPIEPGPPTPSVTPQPLALLQYESADAATGPRPAWVYAVTTAYLLLFLGFLCLPAWLAWQNADNGSQIFVALFVVAHLVGGASLMVIPVRVVRRRPIRRRSIWVPVVGSGLLFGLLALGVASALWEYLRISDNKIGWHLLAAGTLSWAGWSVLFAIIALPGNPYGVAMRLHRWLIAGSVLELLVAVPTHVVVRRRPECCAGIATGFGICLGVAVMFVSFGPSVLLLFYRRRKQITRRIDN
jgi:hypothetical protein